MVGLTVWSDDPTRVRGQHVLGFPQPPIRCSNKSELLKAAFCIIPQLETLSHLQATKLSTEESEAWLSGSKLLSIIRMRVCGLIFPRSTPHLSQYGEPTNFNGFVGMQDLTVIFVSTNTENWQISLDLFNCMIELLVHHRTLMRRPSFISIQQSCCINCGALLLMGIFI